MKMLLFDVLRVSALLGCNSIASDTASLRQKFSNLKIDAVFPGDESYEKFSAPFNERFSYLPAAIVFPNTTEAVAKAVIVGSEENLPVSARSGGHSYTAYGLGGTNGALVIDLQRFKKISVDSSTGEAVIGTGNRLGDLAIALNNQGGRALPHGTCPYVGLGGHAAFGGFAFSSRQWGLTLDNIIGHEVVLANGSIVTTSKTSHPNLFWALRGAGASFGIMTSMHFRTYPAPREVTTYEYNWQLKEADFAHALVTLQRFCMSEFPVAQLGIEANLGKGDQSGKLSFSFAGAWYGARNSFDAIIQPFLTQMPSPAERSVKTTDWINSLQAIADGQALSSSGVDLTEEHDTFYAKSLTIPQSAPMSNSSILAFSQYLANQGLKSNTDWFAQLELYGGKQSAVNSVGADETAFAQRSILFSIQFYASSSNKLPPFPQSAFGFLDNMVASIVNNNPPGWKYGAYSNFPDDRLSPSQWKYQYFNTHYQRLTEIKKAYDPKNLFSYPQSITV